MVKKTKNNGQDLWNKATNLIPGGNGLLSKRPERYLPGLWPVYYKKAKGAYIWDLDNNKYLDMAQNGIGSAILGYSDQDVNKAVISSIKNSINTTLNSPEEVELADMLIKLNPNMHMVKFGRGGGEAMSMAVRIARASSGKDNILFSGYHGWNDWYIAANVSDKSNLDEHLIQGLSPAGVPKSLKGTAIPFKYDDIKDFDIKLEKTNNIAAVVIEGARFNEPNIKFLKHIEKVTKKRKIILIVDEITSGFRICDSGSYIKYGYDPDIAVYGKALGNGFAISAVVGKKQTMEAGIKSFISSTMWTERVGFTAAIATLKKMKKIKLHKHLIKTGKNISKIWIDAAKRNNLKISVTDFFPLVTLKFEYPDEKDKIETLFIQCMLERGILSSKSVYVTAAHGERELKRYKKACTEVFSVISKALETNIDNFLKTPKRSDAFARLNSN
ncbi:aminotransferase class III-fold pyridoxal phosphate-dependent enzyme [Acinetobacter sp.]|uniref:aminotransferase class III-fold pyridoxal phosphate-dependent enzyme n=1 Tax=Acinetobacter sp. TaxID=472 RepID=UPI000C3A08C0|nr:aminotransferase class III-fold pyridoxal phosphate-dependent enzyme [Acinetobacter sp.]MBC69476.1 aminotransferase class III [Acinetobacter sp.]